MATAYFLGIDVGTSRTAAATARSAPDTTLDTRSFPLGRSTDSAPSSVFVTADGLLFGDAAERRGISQPERLVREFKRSIGDDVPLSVAGRTLPPEQLYAHTVASVIEAVVEREGSSPEGIMLTHPTGWGSHRLGLIRSALGRAEVGEVSLITEPEAAARQYEAGRILEPGRSLAVYDLGGGTFDSVILRKSDDGGFAPLGSASGIDDLGGADFDDEVLRHVLRAAGVTAADLQSDDADMRLALSQLRRECVDAKEALSFDSDVTIPVLLPTGAASVRLTRAEFEDMIAPSVERTADTLEDTLEATGLSPDDVESILLVGGSSRIPLVAQMLSERFDRPIAIDADPKSSIALGAARAIAPAAEIGAGLALLPAGSAAALVDDAPAAEAADVAEAPTPLPARKQSGHRPDTRVW